MRTRWSINRFCQRMTFFAPPWKTALPCAHYSLISPKMIKIRVSLPILEGEQIHRDGVGHCHGWEPLATEIQTETLPCFEVFYFSLAAPGTKVYTSRLSKKFCPAADRHGGIEADDRELVDDLQCIEFVYRCGYRNPSDSPNALGHLGFAAASFFQHKIQGDLVCGGCHAAVSRRGSLHSSGPQPHSTALIRWMEPAKFTLLSLR